MRKRGEGGAGRQVQLALRADRRGNAAPERSRLEKGPRYDDDRIGGMTQRHRDREQEQARDQDQRPIDVPQAQDAGEEQADQLATAETGLQLADPGIPRRRRLDLDDEHGRDRAGGRCTETDQGGGGHVL